jgi:hypothetical protein
MGNAAWPEHQVAWTNMELVVTDPNHMFSLEHVPQFIFVLMNMQRRVEWVGLFDDRERSAGRVGGGLDYELCTAEAETFTAFSIEFETARLSHA